jgi:hypothetical protein
MNITEQRSIACFKYLVDEHGTKGVSAKDADRETRHRTHV